MVFRFHSLVKWVIAIKHLFQTVTYWAERLADTTSKWFGHPIFLLANFLFWVIWIFARVEEFPFGGLTLFVSLEAILMSILILNASTRRGKEDTQLMMKDLDISEEMQETVEEMQSDLDHIHEGITRIKDLLEEEDD